MFQQKPNFFSLFKNDTKTGKQPDYRGTIGLPDGTQMEIAAWLRKDKNGNTYMSGQMSEPRQARDHAEPEPKQVEAGGDDGFDSIPF